jgi:hypothetical protein
MDRQFFKPPPTATSFDTFTPPASLGLPPVSQPEPQARQPLPHEIDPGMRQPLPHEIRNPQPPMSQPTIFNPHPFIGGVQSAPKGAISTPGIPLPPSHKPNIIKPRNDFTALKNVVGFNGPPDSTNTNGMMIPLLIGGGILLIILLR